MTRWSEEQAWDWYRRQGWLRGCNFIGSDCCNRIDQWQSRHAQAHLETAEREIALAEQTGFNTVRLIVEFHVWLQERESFMRMLESYIGICAAHHQKVMLVLTTEAELCRGEFRPRPLGEQVYALGYHQGRFPLSPEQLALPAVHPLESEPWKGLYLEMVRQIVSKYGHDERVICWNVYNEPGIILGDRALPLLKLMFETVRAAEPIQPVCADIWHGFQDGVPKAACDRYAALESDVISWHSYAPFENFVPQLEDVRSLGRPVLLTEWLNRINHNDVREIYPLLYLENIANWCWGFVVGRTQTNEPWDSLWEQYDRTDGNVPYDFTRWQHDLFRPNLRPYDPNEIKLIRRYNQMADERENRKKKTDKN